MKSGAILKGQDVCPNKTKAKVSNAHELHLNIAPLLSRAHVHICGLVLTMDRRGQKASSNQGPSDDSMKLIIFVAEYLHPQEVLLN